MESPDFQRVEGVQCYLPAPGSLTNSTHSFLNVKAALSPLPGNPDGNSLQSSLTIEVLHVEQQTSQKHLKKKKFYFWVSEGRV